MIKRLTKDDESSWELYPKFRNRVEAFSDFYTPKCPIEAVLYEMDQRFILTPNLAGYWVGIQDGQLYAHFASWVMSSYGQNRLFIYQAEADKNAANFDLLWPQVQEWIANLNASLDDANKVRKAEFTTWHHPELWKAYFEKKGLGSTKLRYVIEAAIMETEV